MLPFLHETHSPNILYRRAARLRAATGRNYRSKAELVKLRLSAIALDAVWKPVEILIKFVKRHSCVVDFLSRRAVQRI